MRLARAVVAACALVTVACSKKADGPKAGSGSPAVAAADAALAAPAVDATGSGSDSAGDGGAAAVASGDAGAPADNRAAIPEDGILLATHTKEELVIAKLDRSGVKVQHTLKASEMVSFGWLDAQTLVVKEPYGKNDKPVVMKLVNGKPADEVELTDEWNVELFVTKSGEVWLERCVVEPEGAEPCTKFAYQRIYPSKKTAKKRPKDIDPDRVAGGFTTMGESGAREEVAAPADVKLQIVKLVARDADLDMSRDIVGVKCTTKGATSTHPDPKQHDPAYGYTAKKTRWVLAEPSIYEVRSDVENPVGQIEKEVLYFKPCEPEPLDGFISLGGPIWGQWLDEEPVARWTFRVGTTDVGTLEGTALRANR